MQCDEKRQICLNYASNVPEWTLALQLDAVSKLQKLQRCSAELSEKFTACLSYDKLHPNDIDYGEPPQYVTDSCYRLVDSMGDALAAAEMLLTLAEQFPFAAHLADRMETAYSVAQIDLESTCRRHGCPEVAYKHG